MLQPVGKSLALLASLLNDVSLAVEAMSKVFQLLVLPILQSADYQQARGPARVALLTNQLIPAILLPPLVGELSRCLWLLIKGIDAPRWHALRRLTLGG